MKYILVIILFAYSSDLIADEYIAPALDCCIENSRKLSTQIENQNKVLSKLDSINESLKCKKDTSIIVVEKKDNCPQGLFNCDLCGLIGGLLGALISGLIALIIYKRGERNDRISARNEIRDFWEDIYILSDEVVERSNQQIKGINEYIESVDKEPYKANILPKVPMHQLERIRSLDIDKVKKAFHLMKMSNKDFVEFYNQIDYLYEVYNAIREDYVKTNTKYIIPLSNEFLKLKGEILDDMTDYTEFLRRRDETSKPIYGYLNNIVLEYYEGFKDKFEGTIVPDIKYDYDNLIYRLINDMITKYRDEEIFSKIKERLVRAKEKYVSVLGANTLYMNDLKAQIKYLEQSTIKLKELFRKPKIHSII